MKYLVLELGRHDAIQLRFAIRENPIADAWLERMSHRDAWPLDDPTRFDGFDSDEKEQQRAENYILQCVKTINDHKPIIVRPFTSVRDRDYLNYLHHIFETYHGLLDQQTHDFWLQAPESVRVALAQLNIAVHRCEILGSAQPEFVCTWFGMPKTKTLPVEIMQEHGTLNPKFGSVCLNYAEIGKTLEDLTQDRDNYISDNAFKPFDHYSADFNVRMHEETVGYVSDKLVRMQEYYNLHKDFFFDQGFTTFQDPRLLPLRFPVAELIETQPRNQLIEAIKQHQHITQVTLQ